MLFFIPQAQCLFRKQKVWKAFRGSLGGTSRFYQYRVLDKEFGRMYDVLLSRREKSDYQPITVFSTEEVEMFLSKATEMVEAFKKIVGK